MDYSYVTMIAMVLVLVLSTLAAFIAGETICESIAEDFLALVTKQELLEISLEKHKEDRYWEKLLFDQHESSNLHRSRSRDGKFLTIQLMEEMQQVREKILKSTLHSVSLLSSFPLRNGQNLTDGVASESELHSFLQDDVARIYRQLRNLKIAEWNQEIENEGGTVQPTEPNPPEL